MPNPYHSDTMSGSSTASASPPSVPASSSQPSAPSRPLKRRVVSTPDLPFFTPAATSFHPAPYTPNTRSVANYKYSRGTTVARTRSTEAVSAHSGMDPSPTDANAVFLHPPFDNLPGWERYPNGLNYTAMAENPEWFLVPTDFIMFNVTNPDAVAYPPELEPPRGWCPAKKKDLIERGAEGWPEGEEPRLRCTFCRRTYAGVNAKSMWRRHVYEKHKIAMSNRREGDRPRGRGANKENKLAAQRAHNPNALDSIVSIEVTPQLIVNPCENAPQRSRFRAADESRQPESRDATRPRQKEQSPCHTEPTGPASHPHPLSQSTTAPFSPPPTPTHNRIATPTKSRPSLPSSPYDPLVTPSFRHSPLRLPSDKPWRFSPSHPLYSRTQEIVLTSVAVPSPTPGLKRPSVDDSPGTDLIKDKHRPFELATPESIGRLKATPLRSLLRSRSYASVTRKRHQIHDITSPLTSNMRSSSFSHRKKASSASIDDWASDLPSSTLAASSPGTFLKGTDPFSEIWTPLKHRPLSGNETNSSPMRPEMLLCSPPLSIGAESPVLRSNSAYNDTGSKFMGMGIGLMEAFTLPGDDDSDIDDEAMDASFEGDMDHDNDTDDADEVADTLSCSSGSQPRIEAAFYEDDACRPPTKRRRTSTN